jgi:hypothetical protein
VESVDTGETVKGLILAINILEYKNVPAVTCDDGPWNTRLEIIVDQITEYQANVHSNQCTYVKLTILPAQISHHYKNEWIPP